MNKDVFKFHFITYFLRFMPNYLKQSQREGLFIWAVATFFVIANDKKTWFGMTIDNMVMVLAFILLAALTRWVVAALLALTGAYIAVWRFDGYQTIAMSPGYRAFYLTKREREFKRYCTSDIPKEKERIIASANLHKDGSVWAVMCPGRHHHCIWFATENGQGHREIETQGFLTNKFRFLGREDALSLALRSGQITKSFHDTKLFSEDLWKTPPHLAQKG